MRRISNIKFSKSMKATSSTQTVPISATLSENQLNTVELLAAFFMKIYKKEVYANKISEHTVLETLTKFPPTFGSSDRERCSYLHFYATCHTLLVKDCITGFLNEYPKSETLISAWNSYLNITSVSFGPCLDSIGFILALLSVAQDHRKIFSVGVILSAKKWFKTIEILSEVLQEDKTPVNIKYESQLVTMWSTLFKPYKFAAELQFLQSSNVLLIFQPFINPQIQALKNNISELLKRLRSGVLVFCIILLSESSGMQSILKKHPGTFLYGPVTISSDEFVVKIPDESMKTVPSATFKFFVWEKDFDPGCHEKLPLKTIKSKQRGKHALNLGGPPKVISFFRNGLKKVKFFYSSNDDQIQASDGSLLKSIGTQTDLVSEAVLENKLNSDRSVTDFFMEVFMSELAKSNNEESDITFPKLSRLFFAPCGKFDDKARLAYMYRYATCHTLLMKECIVRFLREYPEADNLILKWRTNPVHCSLSLGPGLDYIAFNLAVLEVSRQNLPVTPVRIIRTNDCCWNSTFGALSDVIYRVNAPLNLHFDASKLIQPLKGKKWMPKTIKYLRDASVLFMFKTLHLTKKEPQKYPPELLWEMVNFMNPGNLIFFMDSALSSSRMREVLAGFPGTLLHGPTLVSCEDLQADVSEELLKSMERRPAQSGEVEFFVWEKKSKDSAPIKNIKTPASASLQTSWRSTKVVEPDFPDVKQSFSPIYSSSSNSDSTPPDQKQLNSTEKTKPVVSKTIRMLKKLMASPDEPNENSYKLAAPESELEKLVESSNQPDSIVKNSFELDAPKLKIASPFGDHSSSEHHPKLSQGSKPANEIGPKKETLPSDHHQVDKIKSWFEPTNESANVVEHSWELSAHESIRAPYDGKTTSEDHSAGVNPADTQLSKPPLDMGPTKETLSDDQVDKINSLISRIDELARSIEDDSCAPGGVSVNKGSVNATEINLLTKRIDKLVTTLESNIGNQQQSSELRNNNCHCSSCKMRFSPCQSNCDWHCSDCVSLSEKTDIKSDKRDIQRGSSSNCPIVPSQFLGHSVRACCVREPSIVIPLEDTTPDMLSLILSCKK